MGATQAGLRDISAGQCFELPRNDAAADNRAVWVVDCNGPHTYEVYDVITYGGTEPKGGAYPGIDAVQAWSEQACFDRFQGFVGIPWTRSSFDIQSWWPSDESWAQGDRSDVCALFAESGGRVSGSQRGVGK